MCTRADFLRAIGAWATPQPKPRPKHIQGRPGKQKRKSGAVNQPWKSAHPISESGRVARFGVAALRFADRGVPIRNRGVYHNNMRAGGEYVSAPRGCATPAPQVSIFPPMGPPLHEPPPCLPFVPAPSPSTPHPLPCIPSPHCACPAGHAASGSSRSAVPSWDMCAASATGPVTLPAG